MAHLLLGPLLRYTGSTQATVWVETDEPCEVAILGRAAAHVRGRGAPLRARRARRPRAGAVRPYEVALDGTRVWPPDDGRPPSTIHTREHERQARLIFGSCRVGDPQRVPYTLPSRPHPQAFGIDALLGALPPPAGGWGGVARLPAAARRSGLRGRGVARDAQRSCAAGATWSEPPRLEVADFEEYTRLYREAWSDPDIRWLLATVPSAMIFDDHDVHDDWNISAAWVRDMRATSWWEQRITGAFMSYWIYQHLGNLSPPELDEEALFSGVYETDEAGPALRRFARTADRETTASRFAYFRDFGRSRLVVIDSRAARVLDEGRRDMVDADEWEWIAEHARGAYDHLIIASTLPVFTLEAIHDLEAWSEAVCAGAWGRLPAWIGEKLRRALDLEHWPAFQRLVQRDARAAARALRGPGRAGHDQRSSAATCTRPTSPRSSSATGSRAASSRLSARRSAIRWLRASGARSACSRPRRRARSAARLARAAGIGAPAASWRLVTPVTFDNSVATLDIDERRARVTIRRSAPERPTGWPLEPLHERDLTPR